MKLISLCITNFNRTHEVIRAFENVLNDERIGEIIISDDCSGEENYLELEKQVARISAMTLRPKTKLYRNEENLGMSRNKAKAIELASNEYCIIFDSDNILEKKYLDALYKKQWYPDIIYMPDFARPHFDYRNFREDRISALSVKRLSRKPMFDCLMNTCNYFVHRETYLKTFQTNDEIKGTDTIWFNYLWLKSGKSFFVVPNMDYQHTVHDGSGWLKDAEYNSTKGEEIKKMILAL